MQVRSPRWKTQRSPLRAAFCGGDCRRRHTRQSVAAERRSDRPQCADADARATGPGSVSDEIVAASASCALPLASSRCGRCRLRCLRRGGRPCGRLAASGRPAAEAVRSSPGLRARIMPRRHVRRASALSTPISSSSCAHARVREMDGELSRRNVRRDRHQGEKQHHRRQTDQQIGQDRACCAGSTAGAD